LVLAFVAAPEIIRSLYRLRKPTPEEILQQATAASSWSQE